MRKIYLSLTLLIITMILASTANSQNNITGFVKYANLAETPLYGVDVKLKNSLGAIIAQTTTDTSGYYLFNNLPAGEYIIDADCNLQEGGITMEDAFLVLKYLQGKTTLTALQLKAADVDMNGIVNIVDVVNIIHRYIMQTTQFPKKWVFETLYITISDNKSNDGGEVRGSTTGDVNGSYSPPQTKSETPEIILKSTETLALSSSSNIYLPLKFADYVNIKALGLIINYPERYLKVNGIKVSDEAISCNVYKGQIRIGWMDLNARNLILNPEEVFAVIEFSTKPSFTKGTILEFTLGKESEIVNEEKTNITPVIDLPKLLMENEVCEITSVWPNPMQNEAGVKFILSKPGNAKISIMDLTGKEIMIINEAYLNEGEYTLPFSVDLITSGTYFVNIIFEGKDDVFKTGKRFSVIR